MAMHRQNLAFTYLFSQNTNLFYKAYLRNYCKKSFLDFNFNCHGNKKLNQNNGCSKLQFFMQ